MASVFIAFATLKVLIQNYLLNRNFKSIRKNIKSVPNEFEDKITADEHIKAGQYELAKGSLSRNRLTVSIVMLILWTVTGGIGWLTDIVISLSDSVYTQSLIFIAIYSLVEMIIGLPFSVYSTFVIEEDFGFNNMTAKMFFSDMLKGILLSILIGAPIFLLLIWIIESVGSFWWVLAWGALTVFQLLLVWAYPRFIAPIFNKFSPLEDGLAKEKIEELLGETGFAHSGLFVMDASKRSSHGNAYFTGLGKTKRIVFFDTLLKQLNADEIKAVLAHELGHFKHKHILKQMIFSTVYSFLGFALLGFLYRTEFFFEAFKINTVTPYNTLLLFMLVVPAFTFFMTPIMSHMSRKNEFEADRFAAKYAKADDLINALVKLFKENASFLVPDEMYSKFYYSHPPALERVAALKELSK